MKILIVGAGPTGLTAALEFVRQGIKPEIVDVKDQPSKLSRAVGILPRSIEILDRTGVGQNIVDEGIKASRINISRDMETLINIDFSEFLDERDRIIGLPQDRTEFLMSKKLAEMGVSVQYNQKVSNIKNGENEVMVVFENGEKKHYDWVIGADGVNSTVRKSLDIKYKGYELEEEWSIADIEIRSEYDLTQFRAWLLKNDRNERDVLVMVPIAPKRVRLVSSTPDSIEALPTDLDVKEIRRSGTFKISIRQADKYVVGKVVLTGDAAHAHSPVGGRGMNLGIEDAAMAVEAILNNTVKQYEVSRKAKAASIIRWTEFARKVLVSKNPLVSICVKILMWCIQHSKILQNEFVKRMMKL